MPTFCRGLVLAALLAAVSLCSSSLAAQTFSAENPLRVALLLERPGGDHAWNDSLLAGLNKAVAELPARADVVVAPKDADLNALEDMFRQAARSHDLVLVASDRLHETLRNNAANFRQTMFGCIDAGVRAPNIMSVTFADEQAAFLAGAASAMLTMQAGLPGINAEKLIGWISGEDVPAVRSLFNGFMEGARTVDPEVRVIQLTTGSFADVEGGRRAAKNLLGQGSDLLVLACGLGNGPALEEIRSRNAYAVGVDADLDAQLPGRVLTSILKRADEAVYAIVKAAAENRFKGKEIIVRDLKDGGVALADMSAFKAAAGKNMPPHMERRLQEVRAEIIRGGIRVKSLRARTLCDCP